ncbi:MAG: efflux RND transporter periplasmic adaptor subunit [Holophagae bacterium]|jgi:HlyD family secretion protein
MKKTLIIALVVIAFALVVWASLREAGPSGDEVEVRAADIRTVSSRVKATGEITPEKRVEISAKVVGEVIGLPVVEGQEVAAGELLVEIERDLYVAARDQARAALRQAEVSVRRQAVQLKDAERNLRRTRQLLAEGLVSQEALDAAQLAVDTAQVEIEAQEHAVDQYRSAYQRSQDDLARTTIRSPMDGTVIQLNAEQGETVVPGSTNLPGSVIMTVGDMSVLLAEVEVSEVDVVSVELGQQAEVYVDALGSEPQMGHVAEIATSGRRDPTQGTIRFAVKIAIDDPSPDLRPAMTAKVDILTATSEDAVAVPVQAVVERSLDDEGDEVSGSAAKEFDEEEVVYLIADGKAVARPVESGVSDDLFVEIKKGVQAGDEVVVGPYRTLKNLSSGDKVFAQEKEDDEPTDSDSAAAVEVRVD